MGKRLVIDEVGVSEGTADLMENLSWGDGACPGIGILQERWEGLTGMRVRDGPAQRSPEPLDTMGLGSIGGRVDQHQLPPSVSTIGETD